MKAVLIDSGPLVSVCSPRDSMHARASREIDNFRNVSILACLPVISETYFFLKESDQRARFHGLLVDGLVSTYTEKGEPIALEHALKWLQKYADHRPDFADAYVLSLSALLDIPIWTFDSEFQTTWKTLAGKRPALVPK
jgi:predicted nucleic acid-binding protein